MLAAQDGRRARDPRATENDAGHRVDVLMNERRERLEAHPPAPSARGADVREVRRHLRPLPPAPLAPAAYVAPERRLNQVWLHPAYAFRFNASRSV